MRSFRVGLLAFAFAACALSSFATELETTTSLSTWEDLREATDVTITTRSDNTLESRDYTLDRIVVAERAGFCVAASKLLIPRNAAALASLAKTLLQNSLKNGLSGHTHAIGPGGEVIYLDIQYFQSGVSKSLKEAAVNAAISLMLQQISSSKRVGMSETIAFSLAKTATWGAKIAVWGELYISSGAGEFDSFLGTPLSFYTNLHTYLWTSGEGDLSTLLLENDRWNRITNQMATFTEKSKRDTDFATIVKRADSYQQNCRDANISNDFQQRGITTCTAKKTSAWGCGGCCCGTASCKKGGVCSASRTCNY